MRNLGSQWFSWLPSNQRNKLHYAGAQPRYVQILTPADEDNFEGFCAFCGMHLKQLKAI